MSTRVESRAPSVQPRGVSAVHSAADEMFAAVPSPGLFVSLNGQEGGS
nr:hypothetical protein [Acetobacter persici]